MELKSLFSSIPADLPEELQQSLLSGGKFRMERIVSHGQVSPEDFWYDQQEHEWVLLLQGEAEIEYDDGSRRVLKSGDCELIPSHKRHRVAFTSFEQQTIWLALFFED